MKSKYTSPKSVAKNQTVPIGVDDPRLAWDKRGQTYARQGAEIQEIGADGKSLIAGGSRSSNPYGTPNVNDDQVAATYTKPGTNNNPAKVVGADLIIPTAVTDVSAGWSNGGSGEDLVVTFNWDYQNPNNEDVSEFLLEITTASGLVRQTPYGSFSVNRTQSPQMIILTKSLNRSTLGVWSTDITKVCVYAIDAFYNKADSVCDNSVPARIFNIPVPVITAAAAINGYTVSYIIPTQSDFDAIDIVEYESNDSVEPTGVTYSRVYFSSISPANIVTFNTNSRWVKARFSSDAGEYSNFCVAQKITPISAISVDNTPPNEAGNISASWVGDDIKIDYKLPAQDAGSRIQIQLTAPNLLVGYFYRFPDGSGRDQTTIITKKDLFDQFGEHYSSFTGILRSIDLADNRSAGASFNVPARVNPLSGVTPTFTVVALSNAYSVTFTLPVGATYGEVYASHTDWIGNPSESLVVYDGSSPAVITDTDYTDVYIMIRYYDDFGNTSNYSLKQTTKPLNPGEITSFENPISFGANAVIFAGNSPTSGTRTLFKSGGIFAYDAINTSPSTQIVSNASAGTPTFITTQAQIADWNITSTKIENDLSGTPTKYTGLSATGTYSFWAGSDVSGGNSSADFTVTPSGAVTARNITIIGNGNPSSNLISAGGLFTVKNDGSFTATSATITGNITASSGSFTGNVSIGTAGSLYALGVGGTVNSGIRTIFNKDGVAAYNASGGLAQMLTSPLSDGSVFYTTAANIGGWIVNASSISKTRTVGGVPQGTISLNSAQGYISITSDNVANQTSGINSPSSATDNVFWAGAEATNGISSSAQIAASPFRVTLAGNLIANSVELKGTIRATQGGGFGSYTSNTLTKGWEIDANGIIAKGDALIDMGATGSLELGDFSLAASGTVLQLNESGSTRKILETDNASNNGRIFLGYEDGSFSRQVQVRKSAQVAGTENTNSGGLRNMFTIAEINFAEASKNIYYTSAENGSVLLVWDQNS